MPQMINNPAMPHISPIEGGLSPGKMVRIQGQTPPTAQRFNINLQCGPNVSPRDDIALHVAVRITEAYIARNNLQHQIWGQEQNDGFSPIGPGQQFEILILCESAAYKIAINGKHFCEFSHRTPLQQVTHITIDGDVFIKMLNWEGGAPSAPSFGDAPSQPAPYSGPPMYGPPGAPAMGAYGGPPAYGAPGQQPYGPPGQYGPPPPPPGYQPEPEKSGFDNFLGQAGTAIAGVLGGSGLVGGLLGNKQQPPSQPYQQPYQQPYPQPHGPQPHGPQPQQPQQMFPGGYGGQSVGGLGSIGSFLSSTLAGSVLAKPHKKKKLKKMKKMNKALKYGVPAAGLGLGAYVVGKKLHHSWSSSSSSSSSSD